jgi:hypothetical protein
MVYGDSLWLETGLQTGWKPACQLACRAQSLTGLMDRIRSVPWCASIAGGTIRRIGAFGIDP